VANGAAGAAGARRGGGVVAEPVDEVLSALADPTRRRLLDLLAARGTASATDLAGELPVSRQAVVKHLAVLDAAGLVAGHRAGREVRYEVRSAALDATARWMASLAADWDRRLARIKAVAEAAEAAEAAEVAALRDGDS
jgi:DNA-binding transcriptional ArsR family regulator